MSVYGNLAKAKVQGRGQKIREDGDFVVRIDANKTQQSNNEGGMLLISEFTILRGSENHPKGTQRSWVQRPEQRTQTDPGNLKAYAMALLGIEDEDGFTPEVFESIYEEEQRGAGAVLRLQTEMTVTKSGRDFCVHSWSKAMEGDGDLGNGVAAAPESSSPPPAPGAEPPAPPKEEMTKEEWLGGKGPAKAHPTASGWEYHPEHAAWGCRKAQ